ncbi:ParB N-terminal domain-containing protein [uncultured Desulfobacter sp.]|uniref:ParB N-terminal domain-containing protein n=1 Tax=uncultured Desulfobacter sp. TaxID=240139 RepID=UPI002AAACA8F|nr:ParB N-terminal domain-containing protein [uncultured Desulfobacter sp.]
MELKTTLVNPDTLTTRHPFDKLFPIQKETLAAISQNMETHGYDPVFPLVVWEEENVVVDGHTRFAAARNMNLDQVPVVYKSFEDEDDALLYTFHIQRNRRNMSDDDIIKCLSVLDTMHKKDKTDQKTTRKVENEIRAKELGISAQKVDKARKVMEYGSPDIQEQVQSGEKSINKAFNEVQAQRRESGEIRGRQTDGLGLSANYTQTLGRFLKELTRIRENGWQEVSQEKAVADIEAILDLIKD